MITPEDRARHILSSPHWTRMWWFVRVTNIAAITLGAINVMSGLRSDNGWVVLIGLFISGINIWMKTVDIDPTNRAIEEYKRGQKRAR